VLHFSLNDLAVLLTGVLCRTLLFFK
jgi:hypothetical protein